MVDVAHPQYLRVGVQVAGFCLGVSCFTWCVAQLFPVPNGLRSWTQNLGSSRIACWLHLKTGLTGRNEIERYTPENQDKT